MHGQSSPVLTYSKRAASCATHWLLAAQGRLLQALIEVMRAVKRFFMILVIDNKISLLLTGRTGIQPSLNGVKRSFLFIRFCWQVNGI